MVGLIMITTSATDLQGVVKIGLLLEEEGEEEGMFVRKKKRQESWSWSKIFKCGI